MSDLLQNEYLTLKEMAQLCQCAYATVKRHIDQGLLPAYHIGRKYFIKREDARAYLEQANARRSLEGYTIRELMEVIPLSYAFIIELIRKGRLEAVKVGRQYIIPRAAFELFIAENKLDNQRP